MGFFFLKMFVLAKRSPYTGARSFPKLLPRNSRSRCEYELILFHNIHEYACLYLKALFLFRGIDTFEPTMQLVAAWTRSQAHCKIWNC